jgi:hypothetical protein
MVKDSGYSMRDPAPKKKNRIISDLTEVRRKIIDAASALRPEKQDEVFLGVWSVRELLAHLAGWDFTNIEAVNEILSSKLPSFYQYYDRDWQSYNARLVEKHGKDDFADLISSVEESHRKLVEFLETVPAEEFDKDRGIRTGRRYKVTIARLLQAEIDDEKVHHTQIQDFARQGS